MTFVIINTIYESLIRHYANQNAGTAFTTKTERVRSQGSLGNVLYNVLSRASEVALYRSRDTSLAPSFKVIEPNVIPLLTLFPLYLLCRPSCELTKPDRDPCSRTISSSLYRAERKHIRVVIILDLIAFITLNWH